MIIKAGTYKWNDVLTEPDFTDVDLNDENTGHGYLYLSENPTINGEAVLCYIAELRIEYPFIIAHILEQTIDGDYDVGEYAFYNFNEGWLNSPDAVYEKQPIVFSNEPFRYVKSLGDFQANEGRPDTFGTWFTSSTTMLIKAGSYKWNDYIDNVPLTETQDFYIPISVSPSLDVVDNSLLVDVSSFMEFSFIYLIVPAENSFFISYGNPLFMCYGFGPTDEGNIAHSWNVVSEGYKSDGVSNYDAISNWGQIFTITEDTYAPTNFGLWAAESWQPYEETETTTPTAESVEAKIQNLIAKANNTTGKSDTDLTSGVNSLIDGYGQGGSCSGNHIIEADELPTENIDETALYKKGDIYYQWAKEFEDMIQVQSDGSLLSMKGLYGAWGIATCEFYYVKTRPTENIHAVDQTASPMTLPLYYVEDEDDVLIYGDFNETGTNEWGGGVVEDDSQTWEGAITDESEATVVNGTYALVSDGWKEYLAPRGSVTITENKTVDVTSYTSAIVNIPAKPQSYMVQTVDELPTDAPYGSTAVVLGVSK